MELRCPRCSNSNLTASGIRRIGRIGSFFRMSTGEVIERYRCGACRRTYSDATADPCFQQKKRQMNPWVLKLLASAVSMNRTAQLLEIDPKTVARKLVFLGRQAAMMLAASNFKRPKARAIQFDDLETHHHTPLKPLSVTLAAVAGERHLLGFAVSVMPARGSLAKISVAKYGKRIDQRTRGRNALFKSLVDFVEPNARISSDESPFYIATVKKFFPRAKHIRHKGRRGGSLGYGELKKGWHDPLFSLNHSFAKMRGDVCRLLRRTWCTTKRIDRLECHILLFVIYHNEWLIRKRELKERRRKKRMAQQAA